VTTRKPNPWKDQVKLRPRIVFLSIIGIAIVLVPLILIAGLSSNPVVNFLFGGVRIFLFWIVAFLLLYFYDPASFKDFVDDEDEK
jgi:amino acid transporter